MKRLVIIFLLVLTTGLFAQLKDQISNRPTVYDGIVKSNTSSLFLGFFNPNNFQMNHSFSMSYSAFGSNGIALGVYTNSMSYKFSDNLNVQLDASLINSPYNSFGREFSDQINGIYISKAAINYTPFKNFRIDFQYRQSPLGYYSPYGYSGYRTGYSDDFFYGR